MSAISPMWTCPRRERRNKHRNQWHCCVLRSEQDHLEGADPGVVATYRALVVALADIGTFEVHAVKTRIGFINQMTFAAVWIRKRFLGGHLILDEPPGDARFSRVELPNVHRFRLCIPQEIDDGFQYWLRRAYEGGLAHRR